VELIRRNKTVTQCLGVEEQAETISGQNNPPNFLTSLNKLNGLQNRTLHKITEIMRLLSLRGLLS
jgi:hypothetical protein